MSASSSSGSSFIANPFTQSWIQALTLAAENPLIRNVKPTLDWIDRVSMSRAGTDRIEAAQSLWDYAAESGLTGMLAILPTAQVRWEFEQDDRFLYERRDAPDVSTFESWTRHLGIMPGEFLLTAEITSSDWTSLVRSEAVRLQKPFNSTAFANTKVLHPECTATWDGEAWTMRFDQIDWLELPYEETAIMQRPDFEGVEEPLMWAIAEAAETLVPKQVPANTFGLAAQPWLDCIDRLEPLHRTVLENANDYSPWFRRTWSCVWPIVYREQNALRGRADLGSLRSELAACVKVVPKLTLWMFVFAKLTCQTQTGMGLGICGDFVN